VSSLITQKKWKIVSEDAQARRRLCQTLDLHPVVARLLVNREVTDPSDAEAFLNGRAGRFHDPFLLSGMTEAVQRVQQAQRNGETVLIFGDYDVDGITASVVVRQVLTRFGIRVVNHIPDRMDDGYGLNEQVLQIARQNGASLVVSVDCGITALRAARLLKEGGIDLIVIDHHEQCEEGIPSAVAVIDPKRKDCPYPFKHLAAVGLAAKFAQALVGEVPRDILDLVALGTIADVVPLSGENRAFVKIGLPHIEETKNKGLQALLEVARISGKTLKPYHAGFIIGPRINAAGRMDSARRALDLLLNENETEALALARELDAINTRRQQLQRTIIQEAMAMIEQEVNFKDHRVIVLAKQGWHKGVLGIVASRVVETFYRPAVIASIEADGWGTASARSIDGFPLHEALASCSDVLKEFGGHRLAAGLTVHQDHIDTFRNRINDYALKNLDAADLIPTLLIDCEVPFSTLNVELIREIDSLEPYGEGNRPPVLCSRGLTIKSRPAVLAKDTLKFWVSDGTVSYSVVGFGMGKYQEVLSLGQTVDLAYELAVDDWNKAPTVQLKLKDVRMAAS